MANDSGKKGSKPSTSSRVGSRASQERSDKGFSGGMHSLDSTQVPLKTSDGEPDWDAIKGKGQPASRNSKKK